jgi:starvation-inducible DNA-binding protein
MGKFAAFQMLLARARRRNSQFEASGDDGTNDLLVSDVLRRNELQVWFVSEQLAGAGLAGKDEEAASSPVKAHA